MIKNNETMNLGDLSMVDVDKYRDYELRDEGMLKNPDSSIKEIVDSINHYKNEVMTTKNDAELLDVINKITLDQTYIPWTSEGKSLSYVRKTVRVDENITISAGNERYIYVNPDNPNYGLLVLIASGGVLQIATIFNISPKLNNYYSTMRHISSFFRITNLSKEYTATDNKLIGNCIICQNTVNLNYNDTLTENSFMSNSTVIQHDLFQPLCGYLINTTDENFAPVHLVLGNVVNFATPTSLYLSNVTSIAIMCGDSFSQPGSYLMINNLGTSTASFNLISENDIGSLVTITTGTVGVGGSIVIFSTSSITHITVAGQVLLTTNKFNSGVNKIGLCRIIGGQANALANIQMTSTFECTVATRNLNDIPDTTTKVRKHSYKQNKIVEEVREILLPHGGELIKPNTNRYVASMLGDALSWLSSYIPYVGPTVSSLIKKGDNWLTEVGDNKRKVNEYESQNKKRGEIVEAPERLSASTSYRNKYSAKLNDNTVVRYSAMMNECRSRNESVNTSKSEIINNSAYNNKIGVINKMNSALNDEYLKNKLSRKPKILFDSNIDQNYKHLCDELCDHIDQFVMDKDLIRSRSLWLNDLNIGDIISEIQIVTNIDAVNKHIVSDDVYKRFEIDYIKEFNITIPNPILLNIMYRCESGQVRSYLAINDFVNVFSKQHQLDNDNNVKKDKKALVEVYYGISYIHGVYYDWISEKDGSPQYDEYYSIPVNTQFYYPSNARYCKPKVTLINKNVTTKFKYVGKDHFNKDINEKNNDPNCQRYSAMMQEPKAVIPKSSLKLSDLRSRGIDMTKKINKTDNNRVVSMVYEKYKGVSGPDQDPIKLQLNSTGGIYTLHQNRFQYYPVVNTVSGKVSVACLVMSYKPLSTSSIVNGKNVETPINLTGYNEVFQSCYISNTILFGSTTAMILENLMINITQYTSSDELDAVLPSPDEVMVFDVIMDEKSFTVEDHSWMAAFILCFVGSPNFAFSTGGFELLYGDKVLLNTEKLPDMSEDKAITLRPGTINSNTLIMKTKIFAGIEGIIPLIYFGTKPEIKCNTLLNFIFGTYDKNSIIYCSGLAELIYMSRTPPSSRGLLRANYVAWGYKLLFNEDQNDMAGLAHFFGKDYNPGAIVNDYSMLLYKYGDPATLINKNQFNANILINGKTYVVPVAKLTSRFIISQFTDSFKYTLGFAAKNRGQVSYTDIYNLAVVQDNKTILEAIELYAIPLMVGIEKIFVVSTSKESSLRNAIIAEKNILSNVPVIQNDSFNYYNLYNYSHLWELLIEHILKVLKLQPVASNKNSEPVLQRTETYTVNFDSVILKELQTTKHEGGPSFPVLAKLNMLSLVEPPKKFNTIIERLKHFSEISGITAPKFGVNSWLMGEGTQDPFLQSMGDAVTTLSAYLYNGDKSKLGNLLGYEVEDQNFVDLDPSNVPVMLKEAIKTSSIPEKGGLKKSVNPKAQVVVPVSVTSPLFGDIY